MKRKSLLIFLASSLLVVQNVSFGQAPNLGTTSSFALFTANGALTNSGASTVTGDIGTNVGAFSGFNTATVVGQTRLPGSSEAAQAAVDVTAAYNSLTSSPCSTTPTGLLLGNGQVITPGVYCQNTPAAASTLSGTLTLNGAGIYIIRLNGALTTTAGSSISLTNGACFDNVYFQVNGAVDIGAGSVFRGTILANGAISLLAGASLEGRGLSIAGAIALSNNTVMSMSPTLSLSAVAGSCDAVTNKYVLAGTISLINSPAGTITLTDGSVTTTVSVTAGQSSASFSLSALDAGTGMHSVTANGLACSPVAITYTSPVSCTVPAATASLGGLVFSDTNGDGVLNGTDSPLSGINVILLNSVNTPIASTTTVLSGLYSFTGLASGTPYSVSFTTPANYTATGSNVNGIAGPITLAAGETNTSLGASYQPIAVSVTPALSISVTSTVSQTATNQYTLTGVVSLTAAPAGTLLITDGLTTTTVSVTAGQPFVSFSLPGLMAGATSHTVTVSGVGYLPASVAYTAPAQVVLTNPMLSVQAFVSLSKAAIGDLLTYSLVLTNSGSTSATTTVRDSISAGGTYVAGSAIVPPGTLFTGNQPTSLWTVPFIDAGQSLTLTFQVKVDSSGILYNIATVSGDTAKVCSSIPVKMCEGDEYTLTAPAGRASYNWYRNNVLITAQTTNKLVITEPGTYSLGVDNTGGLCPDFSCCPFILELDTLPSYQAITTAATCLGNSPQANGTIVLSGFNSTHSYQYSLGSTFDPAASLSGVAKMIPGSGLIATTLPNPAVTQLYTVRVYNSSGCYTDATVMLIPTVCGCPADICVPYMITQTKRPARIGDPTH
jgi:uncharacterized repeat protein (TIGR01451 family)